MPTPRPNSSPNTSSPPSCAITTVSVETMINDLCNPSGIDHFPCLSTEELSPQSEVLGTDAQRFYLEVEEDDRLRVLLTMSIGTGRDLAKNERLLEHIKKGRMTKAMISTTGKKEFSNEIIRRANLMDIDPKVFPRPKAWANPKRLKWMMENKIDAAEEEWMMEEFDSYLKMKDDEAADDIIPGSNIRKADRYKMRLYEAVFWRNFGMHFYGGMIRYRGCSWMPGIR